MKRYMNVGKGIIVFQLVHPLMILTQHVGYFATDIKKKKQQDMIYIVLQEDIQNHQEEYAAKLISWKLKKMQKVLI